MLENVQMSEAKNDLASPIYVCPIDPQIYQFVFVFFVKIRFSIVTFFTAFRAMRVIENPFGNSGAGGLL